MVTHFIFQYLLYKYSRNYFPFLQRQEKWEEYLFGIILVSEKLWGIVPMVYKCFEISF
jgi:hypothetical protein